MCCRLHHLQNLHGSQTASSGIFPRLSFITFKTYMVLKLIQKNKECFVCFITFKTYMVLKHSFFPRRVRTASSPSKLTWFSNAMAGIAIYHMASSPSKLTWFSNKIPLAARTSCASSPSKLTWFSNLRAVGLDLFDASSPSKLTWFSNAAGLH